MFEINRSEMLNGIGLIHWEISNRLFSPLNFRTNEVDKDFNTFMCINPKNSFKQFVAHSSPK